MLNKTKGKKTEAASFKAVVASVTKKMAQPRVAESAKLTAENKARKGRENRRVIMPYLFDSSPLK